MQKGGDKYATENRLRGRTRPAKRKFIMTAVAPTPAPKRKKTSEPAYLATPAPFAGIEPAYLATPAPFAGIAPGLVSPCTGIGAVTRTAGSPSTPWPKSLRKGLRIKDRITFVSDLKQGLTGGYDYPDAFIKRFAIFEYIGIIGTPGQRRLPGDKVYETADDMITAISDDLYERNLGVFFGGFVGLDSIIHQHLPESYRIVHQVFCGSREDVAGLTKRLYNDTRLYVIVCMTGQEHVPDTYIDKTVNGCYLRDGVELADFSLENEAGGFPSIHHSGGATFGAQGQMVLMPTPRRPNSGPAYVPGKAQAPPAPPATKPRPPAPRKVKQTENEHIVEVQYISEISFKGNKLELEAFKQSDYIAMHKAMACFVAAGLTDESTAKAVKTLRGVRERVKLGRVEINASIRNIKSLDFFDD